MCEKLEFNEMYKAFTEVLHREVQTFEQCEDVDDSKEDQDTQQILLKEIYIQFSRVMMQGLLRGVLLTDMATGVANLEAFLQFIGKQLATGRIHTYTVFFFNVHNFKYVNKIFPYKEGDVILRNYAGMVDKTIAEGVETKEQLRYLRQVGCDIVQGYVFDKPMPESEFEVRLEQGYKDEE